MSHKGSWNRVRDIQAWNNCPLWDKKPTRLIDIIKTYPAEMLTYEAVFDIEQYDLPIETHFKSIIEMPIGKNIPDSNLNESTSKPRVFLITNNQDQTCKVAVWMEAI
jgi:hypothetical protein